MDEVITGAVAQIVSDRELIINRGTSAGVEDGMLFKISDGEGVEVVDPETNESLGKVTRVKIVVKVVQLSERFAIARTYRTRRVNVGGSGGFGGVAEMFNPPKYETRVETLRYDKQQGEPIGMAESIVAVGDVAESTTEDEADIQTSAVWRRTPQ